MNEERRVGYRVVTPDLKSLGLRNNPNILDYSKAIEQGGVHQLPPDQVEEGNQHWGGWGGIWVAPTLSRAKQYVAYMEKEAKVPIPGCRIFIVTLGRILFENSTRIKTDSVEFLAEVIPG